MILSIEGRLPRDLLLLLLQGEKDAMASSTAVKLVRVFF